MEKSPELKMMSGIKIKGHVSTWSAIKAISHRMPTGNFQRLYLMENDRWGDEAPCLIINAAKEIILDSVWNGFDDLEELAE